MFKQKLSISENFKEFLELLIVCRPQKYMKIESLKLCEK